MKSVVAIFIFSAIAISSGTEEEETPPPEGWSNRIEDMVFCLNQENVTESEMKNFIFAQESDEVKESLKMGILCFAKRIKFFDGIAWNMTAIEESEEKNPEMLADIKKCLKKDDPTKNPQERAYLLQKCLVDKEDYDSK